jgi:hypothetical protein
MDKLTVYVPRPLAARVRNAVAHLAGAPLFLTQASLGEEALDAAVSRLEREHNGGKPFPPAPKKRPGRPVGSKSGT